MVSLAAAPVQPAGLGAEAPVATPAAQHPREVARPGDAHAMGPVDKGLGPDIHRLRDLRHLLQREFPGQHHALAAQLLKLQRPLHIVYRRLGGGVEAQRGIVLPEKLHHRQILHDDRVRSCRGDLRGGALQSRPLRVHHQSVHGDVDLRPPAMTVRHRLPERGGGKVGGVAPGVEAARAQIHRVRSAAHGGDQLFHAPCRGQYLRAGHVRSFPPGISPHAHLFSARYSTTLFAAAQGGRKEMAISEFFCVHFSVNMV